ncbi:protein transport protein Sec16B [Genypterus blacodes]|uniref:protein transport protein Sec16B n=1 Tax=Genypterus blacodes TaxID=154954 RepID=UPI003F763C01
MDPRGPPWSEPGRHSHRVKDRDEHYRYGYQDRDQSYPPLDRDQSYPPLETHWPGPDELYRTPQYSVYNTQQYPYGYGPPEHQRPQSRHGYDYPPHSHWDYRENYSSYDHDYYRGHQTAGQWGPQDPRSGYYQQRTQTQEHPGSSYAEEHRYDQQRNSSHHYLNDYDEKPSRDNEETSSYYQGTLASSKNSGLSSSSYELSQYINGAEQTDAVPQTLSDGECEPVHQVSAPLKYTVSHAVVSFGPGGQLLRLNTRASTQQNLSKLEIHSLEVILGETQEQLEMRNFPGPLTREDLHKADAIEFAQQRAGACMSDDMKLHDKSSAALLWNLLILLCRQNGQIVGSDIAELLIQNVRTDGCGDSAPTLIDFDEDQTSEAPPPKGDDLLTGSGTSSGSETQQALKNYTQLLLAGRKKEALDSAMSGGLWGHALFLASKMDNRSYSTVLNRFTGQLTASDPLQTLFQLLSGRIPAVATCSGNEKWGDWRPHLAVMLSNETEDPAVQQKAIITMGDTLASRGLLHAAHVCYLTAGASFGVFTLKRERLVLLGSSHRQSFNHFATNSAIHCTELYEYSQTLGSSKHFSIASFQVYRFLYASRLLDWGLTSQAFRYCELVGEAILRQKEPSFVLTGEVIKLADRLRHSEGQFSQAGCGGPTPEPEWLKELRQRHCSPQMRHCDYVETYQSPLQGHTLTREDNIASSEYELGDPRLDVQSLESELLIYRGTEDQETTLPQAGGNIEEAALSWDSKGGQDRWPVVPTAVYANARSTVPGRPDLSYYNTNSAEVRPAGPHCPLKESAANGEESSSAINKEMVGQMPMVDFGQQWQIYQTSSQGSAVDSGCEVSQPTGLTVEQSQGTNAGWFRGWFKTKPKHSQQGNVAQSSSSQTELSPPTSFCSPPPPPTGSPSMYPPQQSTVGINPFSRKAGQHLG